MKIGRLAGCLKTSVANAIAVCGQIFPFFDDLFYGKCTHPLNAFICLTTLMILRFPPISPALKNSKMWITHRSPPSERISLPQSPRMLVITRVLINQHVAQSASTSPQLDHFIHCSLVFFCIFDMLSRWRSLIDRDTRFSAADVCDSLTLPYAGSSSHSQTFLGLDGLNNHPHHQPKTAKTKR